MKLKNYNVRGKITEVEERREKTYQKLNFPRGRNQIENNLLHVWREKIVIKPIKVCDGGEDKERRDE